MNENTKKVALKELYPIIKEQLDKGGTVKIPITGTSMLPLLVQGRDFVVLKSCEKAEINDIIFYRRDNGQFVLHRIIGIDENGYILCGDNQWVKEHGIKDKNIIGVVTEIHRNGKVFGVNDKSYVKYYKCWLKLFPIRKPLIKVLVVLRAIKRKMSSR
ncbi:MAG: S24/S26 family peptidase [Clostridia bacterium]|nr:S24/S26 family peptidase [Clostridia bacterium]